VVPAGVIFGGAGRGNVAGTHRRGATGLGFVDWSGNVDQFFHLVSGQDALDH